MKHSDGFFRGVRDQLIYYQYWLPDEEPKAVLLIAHGLGEHSGRYGNVVDHLIPLGYAVYALDHVGHGRSEGPRTYVERFADYTTTLKTYEGMVRDWQPGKPVFLLGHSMGGVIAAAYALQHQDGLAGLVLSAAALDTGDAAPPIVAALAKLLSKVAPKMGTIALDPTQISRDPEVVQAYVDDPLVYGGRIAARLATELMDTAQNIAALASTITLPTLVMHGSADKMVNARGSQQLYEAIGSTDKTIHIYDGFFHEICNEPECSMVLNDIGQWLEAHIGAHTNAHTSAQ